MGRITVTREGLQYLKAIGVASESGVRPSGRAPLRPRLATISHWNVTSRTGAGAGVRVILAVLALLILIAILAAVSHAQDGLHVSDLGAMDSVLAPAPANTSMATAPETATTVAPPSHTVAAAPRAPAPPASAGASASSTLLPLLACVCVLAGVPLVISAFAIGFVDALWIRRRLEEVRSATTSGSQAASPDPLRRRLLSGPPPVDCPRVWGVGLTSVVGPVRAENQDRAIAWDQGPYRVAVVADGMGGLPRGGDAAESASNAVARELASSIAAGSIGADPLGAIRSAFDASAGALRIRSALSSNGDGLRTTLIAVVVSPRNYYWGYIGDGGLYVLRNGGALERVLNPHKDPDAPSVLHASLGPIVHGSPEIGVTQRHPGDFLLMGSDGVFDRIPDAAEFARHVVDAARDHFGGDLNRTVTEVIRQFCDAKGNDGFPVCDDNMSLVITAPDNCDPRAWATTTVPVEPRHA